MRANHIPRAQRLRRRIANLEARLDESRAPMDKIHGSKGNPYWGCKGCGCADPHITSHGHASHCRYKQLPGEIAYYRKQLQAEMEAA